jgi:hypothetical protein
MATGRTRFLLEILFLIAVAGASAAFHWGPGAVAAAMGAAFMLVVIVEISTLRQETKARGNTRSAGERPQTSQPQAAPPKGAAARPRKETWVEALERLGRHPAAAARPSQTAQAQPTQRITLPRRVPKDEPVEGSALREGRPEVVRRTPAAPEVGPRAPQLRPPRRPDRERIQPASAAQGATQQLPPLTSPAPPREAAPPPPPPAPPVESAPAAPAPPVSAPAQTEPVPPPPAPSAPPAPPAPPPEPAPPVAAPPESVRPAPAAAPPPAPPPLRTTAAPVQWNLFELQSRARKVAGRDPARDEEWSFLFLYLREFADTDGLLPVDFDSFVRESFPELLTIAA